MTKTKIEQASKEQVHSLLGHLFGGAGLVESTLKKPHTTPFMGGGYVGSNTSVNDSSVVKGIISTAFGFNLESLFPAMKVSGKGAVNNMTDSHNAVYDAHNEYLMNIDFTVQEFLNKVDKEKQKMAGIVDAAEKEIWYLNEARAAGRISKTGDHVKVLTELAKWDQSVRVRPLYDSVAAAEKHLSRSYAVGILQKPSQWLDLHQALKDNKVTKKTTLIGIPVHWTKVEPEFTDIYKGDIDIQFVAEDLVRSYK